MTKKTAVSKTLSRREVLASLGIFSGSAVLGGCQDRSFQSVHASTERPTTPSPSPRISQANWAYIPLDPAIVAETAYRIYPEGGCMYAVVGSVLGTLADRVGEPFRSFPFEMMRYGDGGVGAWGSLCGVVNGGSALIGLFHREKDKETREKLITELCTWYETTPLPRYQPPEPQWAKEAEASVAGSVLCHVSAAQWCETTGFEIFCMERKERCRRLATDGAVKIVEILNRQAEKPEGPWAQLTPEVKSCIECHGRRELGDVMGKMNCGACHAFEKRHP